MNIISFFLSLAKLFDRLSLRKKVRRVFCHTFGHKRKVRIYFTTLFAKKKGGKKGFYDTFFDKTSNFLVKIYSLYYNKMYCFKVRVVIGILILNRRK